MADVSDAAPRGQGEPLLAGFMRFALSSVGAKAVMAITGIIVWLFVIAHLAGNLAMWVGADAMNHYAHALASNPPLVWTVRIGLLIAFPLHIFSAARAASLNRQARPVPYAYPVKTPATMGGRSMMWTGVALLA